MLSERILKGMVSPGEKGEITVELSEVIDAVAQETRAVIVRAATELLLQEAKDAGEYRAGYDRVIARIAGLRVVRDDQKLTIRAEY